MYSYALIAWTGFHHFFIHLLSVTISYINKTKAKLFVKCTILIWSFISLFASPSSYFMEIFSEKPKTKYSKFNPVSINDNKTVWMTIMSLFSC